MATIPSLADIQRNSVSAFEGGGGGFDYVQNTEPSSPAEGEIWGDTGTNPLDRANHTGTQAATTITLTGPALVGRDAGTAGAASAIPLGNGLEFRGGSLLGNFIPLRVANATENLLASDIGAGVVKNNTTAYSYTIQADADYVADYPDLAAIQGKCILLINDGTAGNLTILRDTGVALLNGTSDGSLVLGPGQSATIQHMPTANRWRVL